MRVRSSRRKGEERAVAWEGGRGQEESRLGQSGIAGAGSGEQLSAG